MRARICSRTVVFQPFKVHVLCAKCVGGGPRCFFVHIAHSKGNILDKVIHLHLRYESSIIWCFPGTSTSGAYPTRLYPTNYFASLFVHLFSLLRNVTSRLEMNNSTGVGLQFGNNMLWLIIFNVVYCSIFRWSGGLFFSFFNSSATKCLRLRMSAVVTFDLNCVTHLAWLHILQCTHIKNFLSC